MAESTQSQLRGLVLSGVELRELTKWPESLVEDYLNITSNLVTLSGIIDENAEGGGLANITRVAASPYFVTADDSIILVDATAGTMVITFPTSVGREGKSYIVEKIDSSDNPVTVDPNGTETINGAATFDLIFQYESVEPTAVSFDDFATNWMI